MPNKGSTIRTGPRDTVINKEFYDRFIEKTKLDVDYDIFRKVILESNQEIFNLVINDDSGFKLPENMGYLVITRYKSGRKPMDFKNSLKYNKRIYLTNLHSFGYIHHIKWFKRGLSGFRFINCYRIEPTRLLKRALSKKIKEGKQYHTWTNADFWNKKTTLKRLYKD